MKMTTKMTLFYVIVYFLILYLIALIANKDSIEDNDILFVSRRQWKAILVIWLPSLTLFMKD